MFEANLYISSGWLKNNKNMSVYYKRFPEDGNTGRWIIWFSIWFGIKYATMQWTMFCKMIKLEVDHGD